MDRAWLLRQIDAYERCWPEEVSTARRFAGFVREQADAFERHLEVGHVTASAWVVDPTHTRTLLTHHRKLDAWLQLGGHTEGLEDVLAAALMEAHEESGLIDLEPVTLPMDQDAAAALLGGDSFLLFDLGIHRIPARPARADRPAEPEHDHYDARFLVVATGALDYTVSDESHDLAWVGMDEVETLTTEVSMLRMREKWRRVAMEVAR